MTSRANIRQFDPAETSKIARELSRDFDHLCRDSITFLPVVAKRFPALDLRWYERSAMALRGLGFRLLGDVQTDAKVPDEFAPGFSRVLLSGDGNSLLLLSHVVRRHPLRLKSFFRTWSWDRGRYEIQLSTEFSEGSFCQTSTGVQLYNMEEGIIEQYLPPTLSMQRLVLRHRQLLLRHLRDNPALSPLSGSSLEDVLSSLNRAQNRRAAARRERGAFTEVELWRLGYAPSVARRLLAEMKVQPDQASGSA